MTFLFTTSVSTLAHMVCKMSHAEIADFPVSVSSSCLCHGKSVIQALLYSFIFCRLILIIAGGLMVFSAVSSVSSFEAYDDTDDSVGAEPKKNAICFFAPY